MSFCIVVLLVNKCICHLYNKLTYLLTHYVTRVTAMWGLRENDDN